MTASADSLDEFRHHLSRMMGRTGRDAGDVGAAVLTLAGGILWMKDPGPIEARAHGGGAPTMLRVQLGGGRYVLRYDAHMRRLEVRSGSGSGDLLLGVSDETDPGEVMSFLLRLV